MPHGLGGGGGGGGGSKTYPVFYCLLSHAVCHVKL